MSLALQPPPPIPEATARVARAAFPRGNRYLTLRDTLGPLFCDKDFAALFSHRGQPAYPPWRLALVTVMQFMEQLSDRQAADAVRARLDWKYLLALELTDPASTPASSPSSGDASSRAGPRRCSSIGSWSGCGKRA